MTGDVRAERVHKARALFELLAEEPESHRRIVLDAACGGDEELRNVTERLLASHDTEDDFLAGGRGAELQAAATPDLDVGQEIGPYRLERKIGVGGMSSVFLARRRGLDFEQEVAIKLVRGDLATPELRRRVRNERQILAALQHPNIATLLDAGTTRQGTPYLVMPYIDGTPITDYADRRRLTVEERLELFRTVCAAVHYAHQNLVVHRDLKPSNILVSADGTPTLLDFGIARLLDPLDTASRERTEPLARMLTPNYASPEQIAGERLTTASDTYSLGVLLYRLLSGALPFDSDQSRQEILSASRRTEPPPPSERIRLGGSEREGVAMARRTTPAALARQLRGDLDTISLRALAAVPECRYASVEQLSDDLEHHLAGRPVRARAPGLAYRCGKLLRRHAVLFGAAAAGVILLAGSTIGIARQRNLARIERAKAERVTGFFVDLFRLADPGEARGSSVTVREILDAGMLEIERELQDQPDVQVRLFEALGRVYRGLGLYRDALAAVERALRLEEEQGKTGELELSEIRLQVAVVELLLGRYDEAERVFREVRALREEELPRSDPRIAAVLELLAQVRMHRGDYEEARQLSERSIRVYELSERDETLEFAEAVGNYGVLLWKLGELETAAANLERALTLRERSLGSDHPTVAGLIDNLGLVAMARGDLDAAELLFRRALDIRLRVVGEDHLETALTLQNYGGLYFRKGDLDTAEDHWNRARVIREQALGADHPLTVALLVNLAAVQYHRGALQEAHSLTSRVLTAQERTLGVDHPAVANTVANLGEIALVEGRLDAAERHYRRALELREDALGDAHPRVALTLQDLGDVLLAEGRNAAASESYGRALLILESRLELEPANAVLLHQLALLEISRGRYFEATGDPGQAREAWQHALETVTPIAAQSASPTHLETQARALLHLGRVAEAVPVVEELNVLAWRNPRHASFLRSHGFGGAGESERSR